MVEQFIYQQFVCDLFFGHWSIYILWWFGFLWKLFELSFTKLGQDIEGELVSGLINLHLAGNSQFCLPLKCASCSSTRCWFIVPHCYLRDNETS